MGLMGSRICRVCHLTWGDSCSGRTLAPPPATPHSNHGPDPPHFYLYLHDVVMCDILPIFWLVRRGMVSQIFRVIRTMVGAPIVRLRVKVRMLREAPRRDPPLEYS